MSEESPGLGGQPLMRAYDDDILVLTLNRPERRNAVDSELRRLVVDALEEAPELGARCVILQGNGPSFCSGADLRGDPSRRPGIRVYERARVNTQALVSAVRNCPVPVVAAVQGSAAGLGMSLALASDLLVMASDARMLAAFVSRAVVPDAGVGYLLSETIGLARAKRVLMTGGELSAAECLEMGLATEVVQPADLTATARTVAELLTRQPTKVLGYTKAMLHRAQALDWDSYLLVERAGQALLSTTEDAKEGIEAFRAKRPAAFRNE